MSDLNKGLNVDAYNGLIEKAIIDVSATDREKKAVALWVQGEETDATIEGKQVSIGSDDAINLIHHRLQD